MSSSEYWQERFEKQGPAYVGSTQNAERQYAAFSRALGTACQHLQLGPARRVLDFGCGVGRFADLLFPLQGLNHKEALYVGLDFNPAAIEHARAHEQGPGRCFGTLTLGSLLTVGDHFDAGFAVTVLQHVAECDVVDTCRDLARLCDAVVLVEDDNPERARPAAHMAFRTPTEYEVLLGMRLDYWELLDAERPKSHWLGIFRHEVLDAA